MRLPERRYRTRWLDLRAWLAIQVKRQAERLSWWLQPGAQTRTVMPARATSAEEALPGEVVEAWAAHDKWWTEFPRVVHFEVIKHADGTLHLWRAENDGPWRDHGVWE